MAMAAARLIIRTATASRNPVFRLMSARTLATSATPAPASGSSTDMVFTFASPSEVNLIISYIESSSFISRSIQVFYNQVKTVRQVDVPTMSGNMGILGQ